MKRSVAHGSFTVEHRYDAAPSHVFAAWADPEQIKHWAAPVEGWSFTIRAFDFRVGGGEHFEFGPPGGAPSTFRSRFDDIVPAERIVSAYSMANGDQQISSSIFCLEFIKEESSTLLRLTEHGVFFDGHDKVENRRGGALQTLAQLQAFLALKPRKSPSKPADDKKAN